MSGISFAGIFRDARLRSRDPSTGTRYTQIRLGEVLGVSDSLISKWERGELVPARELLNEIARTLDVPISTLTEAYGVSLEPDGLSDSEREWVAAFRRIPPNLRPGVLESTRLLAASLADAAGDAASRRRAT